MAAKFETNEAKNRLLSWANEEEGKSWYTWEGVDYKGQKLGVKYLFFPPFFFDVLTFPVSFIFLLILLLFPFPLLYLLILLLLLLLSSSLLLLLSLPPLLRHSLVLFRFIDVGKRERATIRYNEAEYFREALRLNKSTSLSYFPPAPPPLLFLLLPFSPLFFFSLCS